MTDMMTEANGTLTPTTALSLITRIFRKEWKDVKPDELQLKKISGGYSNTLWLVSRSDNNNGHCKEPKNVIVRYSGGNTMRDALADYAPVTALEETITFSQVSRYGCGPKLYAILDSCLLVEYLDCHTLTVKDASDPVIKRDIAKCIARFHSMDLPFDKSGFDQLNKNRSLMNEIPHEKLVESFEKCDLESKGVDRQGVRDYVDWDINSQFDFLESVGKKVNSRIVFIHQDPNFMNYLVRNNCKPGQLRVAVCDYELSCYGQRAFDIGGHFANYFYVWQQENPLSGSCIPEENERKDFLQYYLEETKRLSYIEDFDESGQDSLDHLMMEADYGIILYLVFILSFMRHSFPLYLDTNAYFCRVLKPTMTELEKWKQYFVQKYPSMVD